MFVGFHIEIPHIYRMNRYRHHRLLEGLGNTILRGGTNLFFRGMSSASPERLSNVLKSRILPKTASSRQIKTRLLTTGVGLGIASRGIKKMGISDERMRSSGQRVIGKWRKPQPIY